MELTGTMVSMAVAYSASAMAEQAIPAPFAAALAGVFRAAVAGGLGDRDWSDLVEHAEREAGQKLELRPKPPADAKPA